MMALLRRERERERENDLIGNIRSKKALTPTK